MATYHDRKSYICQRIFLENFRSGKWKNKLISNDLLLRRTNKDWPSEDGNIYDLKNNKSLAIEFKPITEDKRGIQTGLGQCITYLNRFSCSYLMCPKEVDGFQISDYMKKTFEEKVFGNLPIGLIEHYELGKKSEINLLVDICETLKTKTISEKIKESRYWARYKDSNPHLIYLILKSSTKCNIDGPDRKKAIYKIFFDDYLFPKQYRNLEPHESEISHFGEKMMKPFSTKKKQLKKKLDEGEIPSIKDAIKELNEHCKWEGKPKYSKSSSDNLYLSYWKNYFKLVDHLDLWDSNYHLSNSGENYLEIGDKFGPSSNEMLDYFAYIILTTGNHFDLILDLNESIKKKKFDSISEAMIFSQKFMEEKGYYKRNPGRAATAGNTKTFQYEFQLWGKLNLFENKERYIPKIGYNFNWDKINGYISRGYEEIIKE